MAPKRRKAASASSQDTVVLSQAGISQTPRDSRTPDATAVEPDAVTQDSLVSTLPVPGAVVTPVPVTEPGSIDQVTVSHPLRLWCTIDTGPLGAVTGMAFGTYSTDAKTLQVMHLLGLRFAAGFGVWTLQPSDSAWRWAVWQDCSTSSPSMIALPRVFGGASKKPVGVLVAGDTQLQLHCAPAAAFAAARTKSSRGRMSDVEVASPVAPASVTSVSELQGRLKCLRVDPGDASTAYCLADDLRVARIQLSPRWLAVDSCSTASLDAVTGILADLVALESRLVVLSTTGQLVVLDATTLAVLQCHQLSVHPATGGALSFVESIDLHRKVIRVFCSGAKPHVDTLSLANLESKHGADAAARVELNPSSPTAPSVAATASTRLVATVALDAGLTIWNASGSQAAHIAPVTPQSGDVAPICKLHPDLPILFLSHPRDARLCAFVSCSTVSGSPA